MHVLGTHAVGFSNELLKDLHHFLATCFILIFSECSIASDYYFKTAISIPMIHFNRNIKLHFTTMTIDCCVPSFNSIINTLNVEVIVNCSVHVIQLKIKLSKSSNVNAVKSHVRILITSPKTTTMFRNIAHLVWLKWLNLGKKKHANHIAKCYFCKDWEIFFTCCARYPSVRAENNPLEGFNYSGEIWVCLLFLMLIALQALREF